MIKKTLIAVMICLMMVGVSSARTIDGIELPETLTAGDNLLLLNGGGTRVAFMNKVYVAGLWLSRPMTDPVEIKMADEPMAIRLHVTNDFFASSKNITKALNGGFRNAMPKGDLTPIQDKVDRFKAAFADEIKDHDEFTIVYIPGQGTSIYKNDTLKDTIDGYEFKQSVWSIWLHDSRPADEDLKKGMIAGKFSDEALQARQQFVASADKAVEKAAAEAKAAKAAAMKAAEEAEAQAAAEAKAAEEVAMQAAADAKAKAAAEAKAAEKEVKVAAAEVKKEAAAETKAAKKEVKAAATEAKAAVAVGTATAVTSVKKAADAATQAVAAESRVEGPLTRDNFSDEDVFFGLNSAELNADAKTTLTKKALWLKSNPAVAVAVEVYCDSRGSVDYNMALAKRRAQSVVDFMTGEGIDASRMEIVVKGAVESSAGTEKAFANNRRAHFVIK